jgi:hypothetical protein
VFELEQQIVVAADMSGAGRFGMRRECGCCGESGADQIGIVFSIRRDITDLRLRCRASRRRRWSARACARKW